MGIRNGFRWRDKPPPGTRLDRSSPLAAGLQCGWLLNEGAGPSAFDFSGNGRPAIFQSTAAWVVGPNGLALACNGSNTGRADAAVGSILSGTNRGSIVAMASITASSAFQFVLTVDNALQNLFAFKTNGSNQQRLFVNGGPTATDPSAYDTLPHLWVGTYDGATGRLYRDGRLVASGAATGNFAAAGSPNTASLGGSVVVPGTPLTGLVSFGLVYDRALSDGEIRSLAANPWNLIESPGTRRFFAPAGGGGTGGTASPTTLVGSGVLLGPTAAGSASAVVAALVGSGVLLAPSASGGSATPAPLTVSGLVAGWLAESISGATDGDPLDAWPDASGNGHDGSATGTQRPTYRAISINTLPAVEVTADGQWFDLSAPITLPDAYTLYFVASRPSDNLLRILATTPGAGSIDINGTTAQVVDNANTGGVSGFFFEGAGAYLWRFRRSGAGQPHHFAASAVAETSIGTSGTLSVNAILGKSGSGQSTAAGDLFAGIVLYDRDLAGTSDDGDIQGYFSDSRNVGLIPPPSATATPDALAGSGTLPAVSSGGGASVGPAILSGSGVFLASVATGGASAIPTALAGTGTLLVAAASGGGAGSAAPAVLVGAGVLPAVLASGGGSAAPGSLVGSGVLLAPTPGGGTGGTATAAVLVGAGAIPAPSATGGASVAVASLAAHGVILGAVFTLPAGDLIEAVSFLLEGHASVGTLAAGGVWPARAPAEVAFPYLTLNEPLAHTEFASANVDGTRPFVRSSQVELIVYGSTRAEVRALGLAARDALVDAAESGSLTFAEGTLTYFLPAGPEGALDLDDEGPGGSECWQFVVTFEAIVNGALAAPTGG